MVQQNDFLCQVLMPYFMHHFRWPVLADSLIKTDLLAFVKGGMVNASPQEQGKNPAFVSGKAQAAHSTMEWLVARH